MQNYLTPVPVTCSRAQLQEIKEENEPVTSHWVSSMYPNYYGIVPLQKYRAQPKFEAFRKY